MRITHATISADDLIRASFLAEQPSVRHDDGRLQVLLGDEQTWLRASEHELRAIGEHFIDLSWDVRKGRAASADETIARALGPEPRVGGQA